MGIELGKVRFPRVHRIVTLEQAAFVYHHIPGQEGDRVQNMGRSSVRLQIEGIFYGPKALDNLGTLRNLYLKREPVDFVADITSGAYAGKVTIDRLDVVQSASAQEQYSYVLIISEYVPPPKPVVKQRAPAQPAGSRRPPAKRGVRSPTARRPGKGDIANPTVAKLVRPGPPVAGLDEGTLTRSSDTRLIDQKVKVSAKERLALSTMPDALTLGSMPEVTNPIVPLKGALEPLQGAKDGLAGSLGGLTQVIGDPKSVVSNAKAVKSVPDLANSFGRLKGILSPMQSVSFTLLDTMTGLNELLGKGSE
ncbi:MAG: DNA circularization N-terminal domain-containing protein [Chloroflexi bacterium]|nr:DNA circularization N-terminal domain-containing protein [Chloroflexota bacterium]